MRNQVEELKRLLKFNDSQTSEMTRYPDIALDYAMNKTLRKRDLANKFTYFKAVVQGYCTDKGIVLSPTSQDSAGCEAGFFTIVQQKKGGYQPIYKPTYPPPPPQPKSREELISYAYPHLQPGEYDAIKKDSAYWSKKIHETKNKEEVADISNQLYHLMSRLSGKVKVVDHPEEQENVANDGA